MLCPANTMVLINCKSSYSLNFAPFTDTTGDNFGWHFQSDNFEYMMSQSNSEYIIENELNPLPDICKGESNEIQTIRNLKVSTDVCYKVSTKKAIFFMKYSSDMSIYTLTYENGEYKVNENAISPDFLIYDNCYVLIKLANSEVTEASCDIISSDITDAENIETFYFQSKSTDSNTFLRPRNKSRIFFYSNNEMTVHCYPNSKGVYQYKEEKQVEKITIPQNTIDFIDVLATQPSFSVTNGDENGFSVTLTNGLHKFSDMETIIANNKYIPYVCSSPKDMKFRITPEETGSEFCYSVNSNLLLSREINAHVYSNSYSYLQLTIQSFNSFEIMTKSNMKIYIIIPEQTEDVYYYSLRVPIQGFVTRSTNNYLYVSHIVKDATLAFFSTGKYSLSI